MTDISLPVKPHLRKYLVKKLNLKDQSIKISTLDRIGFGMFVIETLCHKREYKKGLLNQEETRFVETIPCTSQITLQIGTRYTERCGQHIRDSKVFMINKKIKKL